jgi:hypothetical protein
MAGCSYVAGRVWVGIVMAYHSLPLVCAYHHECPRPLSQDKGAFLFTLAFGPGLLCLGAILGRPRQ